MVEFCQKFNCVLSVRLEYNDELWGWGYANHTGTGTLGALQKYDVDLTGAGCYLMKDRYDMIQYTQPIQTSSVIHVLPKPKPLPYWHIPILAFTKELWVCFGIILGIATTIIYILNRIQYRIFPQLREQKLIDYALIVLKMSIFQSTQLNYSTFTNTLFYGTFLLYSLMIGNLYLGGLSSVMTVTPYEPPIDTLEKLVNSEFSWGGTSVTWIYAITESTDPIQRRYVSKYMTASVEEFHRLLKNEKTAVVIDKTQGGTYSVLGFFDRDCSRLLMAMKEPIYKQYTALITSKTWPYMPQLNKLALMQQESGVRKYWEYKTVVHTMDYDIQRNIRENMKPASNNEPIRLSVRHILGVWFILLFGFLFAGMVFTVEILLKKTK